VNAYFFETNKQTSYCENHNERNYIKLVIISTRLKTVSALYLNQMGCVQSKAGDIIVVTAKDEEDWWKGEVGGKTGVFPSNYVEPAQ